MVTAGEVKEALARRGIACEGPSQAELLGFEVLGQEDSWQRRAGTLVVLTESYGRDRWEEAHRACFDLERRGATALIRAESAPKGALSLEPHQPLGPVIQVLEELFLLAPYEGLLSLLERRGSPQELVELLGRQWGHSAFLETPSRRTLMASGSEAFSRQIGQLPLHELLGLYPHRAIESEGVTMGYLFLYPHEGLPWEAALDRAAAVLQVLLERIQSSQRWEDRKKEELLRRLLFATEAERQDLEPRDLKALAEGPSTLLVCGFKKKALSPQERQSLQDNFRIFFPKAPMTWLEGRLVALMEPSGDLRSRILQLLKGPLWSFSQVGVGPFRQDLRDLAQSYHEALRALKMTGELSEFPALLFWEDCDLQSLLMPLLKGQESRAFVQRHLGPLLQEPELLRTLEVLIGCGWRQVAAAKRLAVHYNTLRYRIDRIHQILGKEIQETEAKTLSVALELLKLSERLPAGPHDVPANLQG